MRTRMTAVTLAALLSLALTGCGGRNEPPAPPPDLTGEWEQVTENAPYYHIATITEDTMEIWWYTPEDDSRDLYWYGTFVPPTTGDEPYPWQSENLREEHPRKSRFTLTDETKEFIYKEGEIQYNVMVGNMKMAATLRKLSPLETAEPAAQP